MKITLRVVAILIACSVLLSACHSMKDSKGNRKKRVGMGWM